MSSGLSIPAKLPLKRHATGEKSVKKAIAVTAVLAVRGQVDRSHPPAPELALKRVAVGQGGLESFEGLD